jgi:membrane protein YqaA with SNARE-associated domain
VENGIALSALFGSSFLASTLLPGGSEAALFYAQSQAIAAPLMLWTIATAGNTLGGFTNWGIGLWIRRRYPHKALERPPHRKALRRIRQYGHPLLLLSWLPVIGDPLCFAAGWAGIRPLSALLYIGLGKGLRYALLLGTLLSTG